MRLKKESITIIFVIVVGIWMYLFCVWEGILWIDDPIKRKYPVKGIDVSHYQGDVDWKEVEEKMNITFAFIKATEGSSHVDEMFSKNWKEAAETNIYIGAYHFFSFDSSGKEQAEHFIKTVKTVEDMLPPVVDVEYYGDKENNPPPIADVREHLDDFLYKLEDYYGCKPIIYSTLSVYEKYLNEYYNAYPIWIRNTYFRPFLLKNRQWTFWQYSAKGEWPYGTEKEQFVDKNVFAGSKEAFLRYFGYSSEGKEK